MCAWLFQLDCVVLSIVLLCLFLLCFYRLMGEENELEKIIS